MQFHKLSLNLISRYTWSCFFILFIPTYLFAQSFQHNELLGGTYDGSLMLDMEEGDFDQDGLMDFAVFKHNRTVSWFRNMGNGDFEERVAYSTVISNLGSSRMAFITVGDINSDGAPDIVISNNDAPERMLLLTNDGDGHFSIERIGATGCSSEALIDDYNMDGYPDILVNVLSLKIMFQDSIGDFTEVMIADTLSHENGRNLTSGDFNMDGKPDFVVGSASYGSVIVYINDGTGNFTYHVIFDAPVGDDILDMATTDFDNDGDYDIIAGFSFPRSIKLFENTGSLNFTEWTLFNLGSINPDIVKTIDMNQDGFDDIVTAQGWYENALNFPHHPVKAGIDSMTYFTEYFYPLNLDADPAPEIVHNREGRLGIFDEQGGNTYSYKSLYSGGFVDGIYDISWVDVDQDGKKDFYFSSEGATLGVLRNLGGNSYDTIVIDSTNGAAEIFIADIDLDGDSDVVRWGISSYGVHVYENLGSWNYSKQTIGNSNWEHQQIVDFDGDGDQDLLMIQEGGSHDYALWYEFTGGFNFTRHIIDSASSTSNNFYDVMKAHDFNKDGLMDVIIATEDNVRHFENTGSGFTKNFLFGDNIDTYIVIADFNNDSWMDFVICDPFSATDLMLFTNNAGSGFTSTVSNFIWAPSEIEAGDIDHDGDLDLVYTSTYGSIWTLVGWRLNNNGVFIGPNTLSSRSDIFGVWGMELHDYDQDGDIDWLMASADVDGILWLENLAICDSFSFQSLSADLDTVCKGTEVKITISGNLSNDAYWALYSDSCTGTLIDRTWGHGDSNWTLTVDSSMNLYITGEGNCAKKPNCQNLNITVPVDIDPPDILCKPDTTLAPNFDLCTYKVLDSLFQPSYFDECGIFNLSNDVTNADSLLGEVIADSLVVTWTVEDHAGLTNSCTQIIKVEKDDQSPQIDCKNDTILPPNFNDCTYQVLQAAFQPTVDDYCGINTVTNDANGNADLIGLIITDSISVTWTAVDINGLDSSCIQVIKVEKDVESPQIECHNDTTVIANFDDCSYHVLQPHFQPIHSDNCGIQSISNNANGNADLTGYVIADSLTVSWTVEDINGLQSSCTQKISVISEIEIDGLAAPATDSSNGSIDITVTGAIPPITYSWSTASAPNFSQDEDLPEIPAGEYTVAFSDSIGCSGSKVFTVPDDSSSVLSIVPLTQEIRIYPNPTFDHIMVSGLKSHQSTVTIIDMKGQRVLHLSDYQGEPIAINHLPSSTYILLAVDQDKTYRRIFAIP